MENLNSMAEMADAAIIALEGKARGAIHIASIDDQIWFLESFGQPDSPKDWKAFSDAVQNDESFNPLSHYGKALPKCYVKARLTYSEWHAVLDIEVEPERMYGSRMSIRWSPLRRDEETPDTSTWEWQDMNAVARHVIGYAIMDSQTRACFANWTFLSQ